jgi:hypothetical protein
VGGGEEELPSGHSEGRRRQTREEISGSESDSHSEPGCQHWAERNDWHRIRRLTATTTIFLRF